MNQISISNQRIIFINLIVPLLYIELLLIVIGDTCKFPLNNRKGLFYDTAIFILNTRIITC